MPQTSPMSWTIIIFSLVSVMIFSKSLINWVIKSKATNKKFFLKNLTMKWKF